MFVTGCHRSGTSLLASLLRDLVASDACDPQADLEVKLENPLGFFETHRLVASNDYLLRQCGCAWNRPPLIPPAWDREPLFHTLQPLRASLSSYALSRRWVDKDPRLCFTYPAYLHVFLKRVPLVIALREPLDVATSLYARDGMPPDAGLALWFLYNHHLAAALDSTDLLLPYARLLALGDSGIAATTYQLLAAFLERHCHERPSTAQWQQIIERRLLVDLNRAVFALPPRLAVNISPDLLRHCQHAAAAVQDSDQPLQAFQEAFQALPCSVLLSLQRHQLVPDAASGLELQTELLKLNEALETSLASQAVLQQQLTALQRSISWRLTAPMRYLWKQVSRRAPT